MSQSILFQTKMITVSISILCMTLKRRTSNHLVGHWRCSKTLFFIPWNSGKQMLSSENTLRFSAGSSPLHSLSSYLSERKQHFKKPQLIQSYYLFLYSWIFLRNCEINEGSPCTNLSYNFHLYSSILQRINYMNS